MCFTFSPYKKFFEEQFTIFCVIITIPNNAGSININANSYIPKINAVTSDNKETIKDPIKNGVILILPYIAIDLVSLYPPFRFSFLITLFAFSLF